MAGLVNDIKKRLDELEKQSQRTENVRTAGKGVRLQSPFMDTYLPPRPGMMPSGGSGWNPDVWHPVIEKGVEIDEHPGETAGALLSVDNCVVMCGRQFKDFGSLFPYQNQVLSGVVMAVFDHPIWDLNTPTLRCQLSCCPSLNGLVAYSSDYTAMPLYYIAQDGTLSVDYRGIPTLTMWS